MGWREPPESPVPARLLALGPDGQQDAFGYNDYHRVADDRIGHPPGRGGAQPLVGQRSWGFAGRGLWARRRLDDDWQAIAYTRGGEAQVAETTVTAGRRGDKLRGPDAKPAKLRLVMRRSRLLGAQGELWPNWRYHCFVTDRHDLDTKAADANHRGHATVELAIRDLKESAGLSRCPSGRFFANGAWLACCVLAHNLARWTARLGRAHPTRQLTVAATIRNRLLTVPGRLVNHSGRHKLRLPLNWPWANTFTTALGHIRNLPQLI